MLFTAKLIIHPSLKGWFIIKAAFGSVVLLIISHSL